jgi:hypothetical protein
MVLGFALLTLVGFAATAEARVVQYMSQHPLPRKVGRGFCYIDVPHYHDFPPSDPRLYRDVGGQYYFVGDPAPFDYDGPRYAYYGPHPVAEADVQFGQPVYCYLRGPHYHWYQPAPAVEASFELKGGAYWYVGNYDPVYYSDQPHYATINEAYTPIVYTRPIVDVTVAPPAFHGEIIAGGPGWRAGAVVGPPVVSAGVTVVAPPPPVVRVGVNIGGPPPVIVEQRREIYEVREHEHHDNGRHEGWYKHGREDGNWQGEDEGGRHGGGWRGGAPQPAPVGGWRGGAAPATGHAGGWRGGGGPAPAPAPAGGWRGGAAPAPAPGGGQHHGGGSNHGWKR